MSTRHSTTRSWVVEPFEGIEQVLLHLRLQAAPLLKSGGRRRNAAPAPLTSGKLMPQPCCRTTPGGESHDRAARSLYRLHIDLLRREPGSDRLRRGPDSVTVFA